jgi:hypothetical protein
MKRNLSVLLTAILLLTGMTSWDVGHHRVKADAVTYSNGSEQTTVPTLSVNPNSLSGMDYEYESEGPSEIQSFLLYADNIVGQVSIYPSEHFEVSTFGGDLFRPENPAIVASAANHFYDFPIYVRLKSGLESATYAEQLTISSANATDIHVAVSGSVTGGDPLPPVTPTLGDYVRINDLGQLTAGSRVVFAARFDDNATSYYAMSNASSGKPTGVLFTSTTSDGNEILPASITDEENSYYWTVGVTSNGYTFTNALGELIGYTSSTNFATGGDNTEWAISLNTAGDGTMVPNYTGFVINNVNNIVRCFALNSNYNFGPYHTNNLNNSGYNFYLDLFVKSDGGDPPTPTVATPTFSPAAGTYSEAQTVTISCNTQGATIHYTLDGSDPTENSLIYSTPLTISETTTLKAMAVKEDYNNSAIAEATYIIQVGVATIFNQDWEGEMNGWTFVDVEGEMTWTVASYQGNHYAYANGYNHGANEDWCISPAFDLNIFSNPTLSFSTAKNYNGNDMEVYFSNDYDGEDPTTATWTALPCNLSTGSWTWTESGDIDLSDFSGSNCYIGFKYTCTDGSAAGWEVDDILLFDQTSAPVITASPLSLTGFSYIEGNGPSTQQSFSVSALHLNADLVISETSHFEISTTGGSGFNAQSVINLTPIDGNVETTTLYVRMKVGLNIGNYNNENIVIASTDATSVEVTCSGNVIGQPVPGDDYIRISDVSTLAAGNRIVFAARFDDNATSYYAMSNASSGKPTGVLFTSTTSDGNEILPASITDEENSYYWTVGVTSNGYTFTNALGELIGYTSSTNFATGGDNTEWAITLDTAGDETMVPNYTGFVINNVNNEARCFALNSNHNFGPYHTNNINNNGYNFYLDLFVKSDGGDPPTPTVATPTFSPAAGTYSEAQTVAISCSTQGATIHYTLDGSDPSESSPIYSSPLTISETTTIKAMAVKEDYNNSAIAEATYIIQVGVATIFNQDWEGEMNGWTFVDVEGEMTWNVASYQGNHYAYANGYNHGANEDWCISPAFNLDNISNPVLSFRTAKNYTGPDLEVFFSNDYDGEDPTNAIWVPLVCNLSQGSWNWVESGDIALGGFSGTNCYIGFKYTCTDEGAAGWEVDDIQLMGSTSTPVLSVTPLNLSGFTYIEGNGPSAEQSFVITGMNIEAPVIVGNTSSSFQTSLISGNGFSNEPNITIYPVNGIISQTIYVRMAAGLAVGTYSTTLIIDSELDDIDVTCNGTVTAQPVPGDNYIRISDVSQLNASNRIVFAARFDESATDYYAMSNAASGKPEGVLFTSATSGSDEILPASILNEEDSFYWTVNITADGYTFTNAAGDMIGYTSSTNFASNGDNTAWSIEIGTSEETAMVPNYTGFIIANANNPVRAFALNGNHNFGPYHTQNIASENYNFFLDIFMQGEGGTCTVAAPTFNPASGTYYEIQEITINCATEGANIYYSLGSEIGPWNEYGEAITVDENMTIWAYAAKEGCNDSPIVSADYIIQNDLTIIFWQEWEDDWDPWHGWTEVCQEGDSLWRVASYGGNHYAYANGYNHPATIDWLISPAFDLDSYNDVVLTFVTARNYNGPDIEVYFSNDYDGQDPTTATWEALECELSQGGWNWVASGEISLNGFNGSNCYIGFKYQCTDDEAAGWEVDDIMLVSGSATPTPTLTATPNVIALEYTNYPNGPHGPSNPHPYTLTGTNLDGEGYIIVTASENFLVSTDDLYYYQELPPIPYYDGELPPTTLYVILDMGLEVGTYEGFISHQDQGGQAYTEVSLTGTVHSENEPYMQAVVPQYIQGNNGSNNNRVPVASEVYVFHLEPNTTYRYTNQFVDNNDGPETAGAGNVIYANADGFYRSTSPSLATEGGYGEFTTDYEGKSLVWLINEPTANARFTPGNQVYHRLRINDGHDGTTVAHIFTSEDYATVLNFGTENDEYSGSAFYVKSDEAPMSFAFMYASPVSRPAYITPIETVGIDYASINQYADFYKELVAGKDGWFGGILPNVNDQGINCIMINSLDESSSILYTTENGHWNPDANTINPNNGLADPIFIDLTNVGVGESAEANVKIWNTDNEFIIENGDNAHYMMTVFNVLGQPMMQQQINAGSTQRVSHNLAKGVYVINLQNNKNQVTVKVMAW